ncbi:AMP-binding protein [Streptomyces sp. NPDC001930]|uniref:AMP-binding protein n=1 Tax=Streptomyces sp. NPDC001930 TaxID=3364625 RepID=UPI0036822C61
MAERSASSPEPTFLRQGETVVTALYQIASALPGRSVLMTRGFGRALTMQITFGQLLEHVERFAVALSRCGLRRGDAVALQVPDCWGSAVMMIACLRLNAVVVLVPPSFDERELEQALKETEASMCVVFDTYLGHRHAEGLLAVSEHLPELRHRVVVGDASTTGALDFDEVCRIAPDVWRSEADLIGPLPQDGDDTCLIIPSADGTAPTRYRHADLGAAALASLSHPTGQGEPPDPCRLGETIGTSYSLTSRAGLMPAVWLPILTGGTGVYSDHWDPAVCLDLFQEAAVSRIVCPAEHWAEMVEQQRQHPRRLTELRDAVTRTADVPASLADSVLSTFGVELRTAPE